MTTERPIDQQADFLTRLHAADDRREAVIDQTRDLLDELNELLRRLPRRESDRGRTESPDS